MKTAKLLSAIVCGLLISSPVTASPSEAVIAQYNLAAEGDQDKVEWVLSLNSKLRSREPTRLVWFI